MQRRAANREMPAKTGQTDMAAETVFARNASFALGLAEYRRRSC